LIFCSLKTISLRCSPQLPWRLADDIHGGCFGLSL
jgi:hypothetical protein